MEFFDKLTKETLSLISGGKTYPYEAAQACERGGKGSLILSKETAFEYGGPSLPAVNMTLFGTDEKLTDEVVICGEDIPQAKKDLPYARIAVISLDDSKLPDEDGLYKALKDIEFSKYRFYPKDCLLRLSPANRREQIRISKKAVSDGLSLKNIGFGFIEEYKKNPAVSAVKIIFITDESFNYKALTDKAEKAFMITESLNKIFDGLELDCASCSLKPICDEVEGMRELHFGKEKKK